MSNFNAKKYYKIILYLAIAIVLPFSGLGCLPSGLKLSQPFLMQRNLQPSEIPDLSGTWKFNSTSDNINVIVKRTQFENTFLISKDDNLFTIILEPLNPGNYLVQVDQNGNNGEPVLRLILLRYTSNQVSLPEFDKDLDKINVLAVLYGVTITKEGDLTNFRSAQELKDFFIELTKLPLNGTVYVYNKN